MGREVRKVPKTWEHPKQENDSYDPLLGRDALLWKDEELHISEDMVMPDFGDEADHFMMYENTTEGTPISPAFSTPEELAHWLANSGASAFAGMSASYESWLLVARGGGACSAVIENGVLKSGVDAAGPSKREEA